MVLGNCGELRGLVDKACAQWRINENSLYVCCVVCLSLLSAPHCCMVYLSGMQYPSLLCSVPVRVFVVYLSLLYCCESLCYLVYIPLGCVVCPSVVLCTSVV